VRAIVTLAQQLGLRVVAEGVETQEELELLRHLGCDLVQGFLFSKPMSVEACEKFLRGYDAGEPREADDLVTPVLRKALSFMGINNVGVVLAGGSLAVNLGQVRIEDHLERYASEVAALAGS